MKSGRLQYIVFHLDNNALRHERFDFKNEAMNYSRNINKSTLMLTTESDNYLKKLDVIRTMLIGYLE